ncbi:GNAT family N-acetyltransferase [Haloarchaeobius amylolyticus]|uniref:GNAT family N-acetyltransferase n=1 Tax=Haloarchaeobius amylolyticus TaxID=1198296 RepID=A0ABD6BL45_9EURY
MPTDSDADSAIEIRRATPDDYEAVAGFTSEIWADRGGDYIPRVYHEWLENEREQGKKTFLAAVDDEAVGIVQAVMLSPDEAWFQGMRVAADYRQQGVSRRLNEAAVAWAREQGATVGRIMIFSWNAVSLGAARASGFAPITEFRFAHPDPDPDADGPHRVSNDPTAAWRYWTHSDAREHLSGLGFAPEESWAVRELTRDDFEQLADEMAVFAVESDAGLAGMAYRSRTYDRELESEDGQTRTETWAEYGLAAWDEVDACRSLFAAIARDGADCGADKTRVVIPETVRFVTDVPLVGTDIADEPDFVLGIDLTATPT